MFHRKLALRLLMVLFMNLASAGLWAETHCERSEEACNQHCGGACCEKSLLKQVWVGMAPVRCRPSQKTPAFAGSASPRAPRSSGPRADYSSRARREVVDGRDAPVQAGPQGP